MNFTFKQKRIAGILTVLPANERTFVEDMKAFDFPESRSLKLKEVMGYDRHRVVKPGVCVSDLAVAGLERLFQIGVLERDSFDALVVVTQSPDHFMPATSNIIQGRLGLNQDLFCLDIAQGCAGYLIGLFQAFLLLGLASIRRVILVNGDVLSRKVCVKDRNSYPLIGDAVTISVVENDPGGRPIYANLKMDGELSGALIIPAGGFRLPSSVETARLRDVGDNNFRSLDDLRMDGVAVFNFVQREVPPMIDALVHYAGTTKGAIDYFLFHQPNRFMLQKLAEKMEVPHSKMPSNVVEKFGNSSGATIPVAVTTNLAEQLRSHSFTVCFGGFGVGLTWASILMRLGPLEFCETIDI